MPKQTNIVPSSQWPGEGLLGCEVGGGLLHNIPSLEDDVEEITTIIPKYYTVKAPDDAVDGRFRP